MGISAPATSQREVSFQTTLSVIEKYKNEVGISRIANLAHLDITKLPVYMAIRPRAKSLSTSQGKGFCNESAMCSAIMESIETYYAENALPEIIGKSISDLKEKQFVNPNHLSPAIQYTSNDIKHNWVNGLTLLSNNKVILPFAEFSLNTTLDEVLIYAPETTGLASGNTYEEALIHSLFENIERENPIQIFDVNNINNDYISYLKAFFNLKLIYHLNSYSVPCFECLLIPKNPFENQVVSVGKGAHFDKHIAMNRAVSEAVQSRVTMISGTREDIGSEKYEYFDTASLPINDNFINFTDIKSISFINIEDIHLKLKLILKDRKQDAVVYRYYQKDICVLKSRIVSKSDISNE